MTERNRWEAIVDYINACQQYADAGATSAEQSRARIEAMYQYLEEHFEVHAKRKGLFNFFRKRIS